MTSTSLEQILSHADLSDATDRLVLADALEEAGRAAEAACLRAGPCRLDGGTVRPEREVVLAGLVRQIEAQLDRLDAGDTPSNCSGICVYPDGELPEGWVRLGDGSGEAAYGPAADFLAELSAVEYDPERAVAYDEPDPWDGVRAPIFESGWELAWEALAAADRGVPSSSRDWPEELYDSEQVEEGTPNDEPLALFSLRTNAGARWYCGPDGVFSDALSDALEFGALYPTREEALESAEGYDGCATGGEG